MNPPALSPDLSPIILASESSIRREMLAKAGVVFTTQSAKIDEEAIKESALAEGAKPRDIADALAGMKASRISAKNPGAVVIGSDQILDLSGELLSKPQNLDEARARLIRLRGKKHSLHSAVVLIKNNQLVWRHVGQTRLWVRNFSDGFLDDYLHRIGTSALHTPGCYKLEEGGVRLFSKIEGDYFNILGLPLLELLNHLTITGLLQK